MKTPPILALEQITFAYPERPALFRGLSVSLPEGARIGLHGPNGSGKTTLFRLMLGLEVPRSGRVLYRGEAVDSQATLHEMRRGVGLVLQNSDDQLFSATVLEDVAFGPLNLGLKRRAALDRAMETLEALGLARIAERPTHRLSAGEKKMASIAAVLSMRPGALLLDEPSASLDDESRSRIIDILRQQPLARITASHDKDFLGQTSSSLMRLGAAGALEADSSMHPPSGAAGA
ncbi:MAG: energy-coupling factor ABC transporter ATP-binding protein [Planctomycetota bacterium]|jgi:cobalt/nickel transport system ATP-binding protein|nr:energy-coupling factor ABC transporter ATP-binding protein [Planctomycetota bacterium]